jgi:hypothetical protein
LYSGYILPKKGEGFAIYLASRVLVNLMVLTSRRRQASDIFDVGYINLGFL